jgi:hypothetical protein
VWLFGEFVPAGRSTALAMTRPPYAYAKVDSFCICPKMSGMSDIPPLSPETLLSAAYWQPEADRLPKHGRSGLIPREVTHEAAAAIGAALVPVLTGSLQGDLLPEGMVFDPADRDVARYSRHSAEGATILFDLEDIRPVDSASRSVNSASVDDLQASPRMLLRKAVAKNRISTNTLAYIGDDLQYGRIVGLGSIGRARGGSLAVVTAGRVGYDTVDGLAQGWARPGIASLRASQGIVGRTEVLSKPGKPFHARRLRSLELLMGGKPAEAPETAPRLSPGWSSVTSH